VVVTIFIVTAPQGRCSLMRNREGDRQTDFESFGSKHAIVGLRGNLRGAI
jgi:hypothetical protein